MAWVSPRFAYLQYVSAEGEVGGRCGGKQLVVGGFRLCAKALLDDTDSESPDTSGRKLQSAPCQDKSGCRESIWCAEIALQVHIMK